MPPIARQVRHDRDGDLGPFQQRSLLDMQLQERRHVVRTKRPAARPHGIRVVAELPHLLGQNPAGVAAAELEVLRRQPTKRHLRAGVATGNQAPPSSARVTMTVMSRGV